MTHAFIVLAFDLVGFFFTRPCPGIFGSASTDGQMFAECLRTISCERGESLAGSNEVFEWLLVDEPMD